MCEPVTILAATVATTAIAGGAVGAYGQIKQGQYASAVANQNAQIAEGAATDAMIRGANEQGLARMKASQIEGRQQALMAAAGVDSSSGSDANLLADSRLMSELDVMRIGNNAAREAWGYKVGGVQARAQGQLDSLRGTYGAVGSILGGVGQAASYGASGLKMRAAGTVGPTGRGGGDYSTTG